MQAHDLLRVSELRWPRLTPDWARDAFAHIPWVVVRRAWAATTSPPLIAVGLRGTARAQRLAVEAAPAVVLERLTPEQLAARADRLPAGTSLHATLLAAERIIAQQLPGTAWGPTGSVGFELATGHAVTRPGSDLDLILRLPTPLKRSTAAALQVAFDALPTAVDCLLETPPGAISLSEWARGEEMVLLRTTAGPQLTNDPWAGR